MERINDEIRPRDVSVRIVTPDDIRAGASIHLSSYGMMLRMPEDRFGAAREVICSAIRADIARVPSGVETTREEIAQSWAEALIDGSEASRKLLVAIEQRVQHIYGHMITRDAA